MVQYAREGGTFGAMTTQLALEELVTRFTQKLPKGGELPMWWIRRLLRQTCESQVIKTEVSVLLIPSSSVGPDRVCLSFLCLLFEMDIPPGPTLFCHLTLFWVHVYRSLAVVFVSLSLYTHHSVWIPMSDSASQQSSRQWPGPAVSPPHRQSEAWPLLEGPVVSEQT